MDTNRSTPCKTLEDLDKGLTNELKEIDTNDLSSLDSTRSNKIYNIKVTRYDKSGNITDQHTRIGHVLYDLALRTESNNKLKKKFKSLRPH